MPNQKRTAHSFHIPVMGTGFTIDTPLKVARYGISSVISLVDDVLIEQIRKFHCKKFNHPYEAINNQDKDARARRITAYLNLLNTLIHNQVTELQAAQFASGSEITRYYEMLPQSDLKQCYLNMLATKDPNQKQELQDSLRRLAVPGSIDVNIMTKLDCDHYHNGKKLPPEFSDASAALRGYANSTLNSSIVFSAGFNPRLYGYISKFADFSPDEAGNLKKELSLKLVIIVLPLYKGNISQKEGFGFLNIASNQH